MFCNWCPSMALTTILNIYFVRNTRNGLTPSDASVKWKNRQALFNYHLAWKESCIWPLNQTKIQKMLRKLADHLAGLMKITMKTVPTDDKSHSLDHYATWHAKGCRFAASFFLVTAIKASNKHIALKLKHI